MGNIKGGKEAVLVDEVRPERGDGNKKKERDREHKVRKTVVGRVGGQVHFRGREMRTKRCCNRLWNYIFLEASSQLLTVCHP